MQGELSDLEKKKWFVKFWKIPKGIIALHNFQLLAKIEGLILYLNDGFFFSSAKWWVDYKKWNTFFFILSGFEDIND